MKKAPKNPEPDVAYQPDDPMSKFFKSGGVYPPSELLRGHRSRWLRVSDLPFSRGLCYRLLSEDAFLSVILQLPGSRRRVRLIDSESLDAYFLKLAEKQRRERKAISISSPESSAKNPMTPGGGVINPAIHRRTQEKK